MTQVVKTQDGRNLRRADNRERIYEAAMRLLEARSFVDLSVEDICAEADVGRATFFRIFGAKTGLIVEFNRRLADHAEASLETVGDVSAREALFIIGEEITNAWNEASPSETSIARGFMQTVTLENIHEGHPELLKLVVRVVEQGLERGEIRSAFLPDFLGSIALFYMSAAAALWFDDTRQDLSVLMHEAIDHWLNGAGENRPARRGTRT